MNYNHEIFKKIILIIPNLKNIDSYTKLAATGSMDLHIDILEN